MPFKNNQMELALFNSTSEMFSGPATCSFCKRSGHTLEGCWTNLLHWIPTSSQALAMMLKHVLVAESKLKLVQSKRLQSLFAFKKPLFQWSKIHQIDDFRINYSSQMLVNYSRASSHIPSKLSSFSKLIYPWRFSVAMSDKSTVITEGSSENVSLYGLGNKWNFFSKMYYRYLIYNSSSPQPEHLEGVAYKSTSQSKVRQFSIMISFTLVENLSRAVISWHLATNVQKGNCSRCKHQHRAEMTRASEAWRNCMVV